MDALDALDLLLRELPTRPTPEVHLVTGRPEWMADAACREHAELDWFPMYEGSAVRPALEICPHCPVREPCLAYAIEHGERGVWGGTSEQERRRMADRARHRRRTTAA
jgi:WhiB family redox-sensing transcriptional regulator